MKIIHIPQGHSARFTKETEQYDICGLYTCEITTCNVVACIGQDKLVLIHVDWSITTSYYALEQVRKDIEWLGVGEVVIISRKSGKYDGIYGGKQVNKALLAYLEQTMPAIEILEKELRDDDNGIYLSFELQKEGYIHNKIKLFRNQESPEGLIYHPYEQQFLCTRQIGYIIGVREMQETGSVKNRQLCIFDSKAWELVDKSNLSVDSSHPITRQEIQSFNKTDHYADILKKLFKIAMHIKTDFSIEQVMQQAAGIAVYLEQYINDYDYALLFKRNLKQIINSHLAAPLSSIDKGFKIEVNLILDKENDVFEEMAQLVDKYRKQSPRTKFKDSFMHEHEVFSRYYLERKKYSDLMEIQRQMRKEALKFSRAAAEKYKTKDYENVTILTLAALKLSIYSSIKGDPYLVTSLSNYNQILTKIGKHQEVYPRLDNLALQAQNIETVQLQLSECESKITTQLTNNQQARIKCGENENMSKIIYVPQGSGAIVHKDMLIQHDIAGLFTDGFSTCNILLCKSADALLLIHIDTNTLDADSMRAQIYFLLESIKEPKVVIVAYRNEVGGGRRVKMRLMEYFTNEMPHIYILEKEVDNDTHGLYLSFEQRRSCLHPNIQTFGFNLRPEGLIHHPYEQRVLSIRKIEQVIGMHESLITNVCKKRQVCLFNKGWEVLHDYELKIDNTHPITKKELQQFSKDDTCFDILVKLINIAKNSPVPYRGNLENALSFVAPHMEEYLNDYDHLLLFKRNSKYIVNVKHHKPQSRADEQFRHDINNLTNKSEDIFAKAQEIVAKYKNNAPKTEFKVTILEGYAALVQHYQERKYYADVHVSYKQMKTDALNASHLGIGHYKQQNYELAAHDFLRALKLYTYCCVKSAPGLATANYNYGQNLRKAGDFKSASIFLAHALVLRENLTQPRPKIDDIEKTKAAFMECGKQLNAQTESIVEDAQSTNLNCELNTELGANVNSTKILVKALEDKQDSNLQRITLTSNPIIFSKQLENDELLVKLHYFSLGIGDNFIHNLGTKHAIN